MYHLPNLSSQAVTQQTLPWNFKPEQPIPDEVRKNKKLRDAWINQPATRHHVYTFNEGTNPNLRISRVRNDGGGNPVRATYALVADYDVSEPAPRVLEYARSLPILPNWIERTLSGNSRFVWLLTEPLLWPSFGFCQHFFKKFADFAFDPSRGMVGFDRKAWEAPERLWTNSCDWTKIHDEKISADVARGWLVQASSSFKFADKEFGPVVPLEAVMPELAKKYPGFASWPGEFALNAQGPTFWIPESASPKSAIIRETGIQTFSAHAPKGFYDWADLLGIAFVREYQAASLGRAVAEIYFDGRAYYYKSAAGIWVQKDLTGITRMLKIARNVSPKTDKQGLTDVDRALHHIDTLQSVSRATPFVFQPSGILRKDGKLVLNTSDVRVLQPAGEPGEAVWGDAGQFPWVSKLFGLFPDARSYNVVRAWLAHGYKHAYKQEPTSGQVLFMAGPVGVGKTLLNNAVFGALFGGFAEATAFLTGEDNFNSELFDAGFWCQDDGSVSSDPKKMRFYSEMLKKTAANGFFRNNGKFQRAVMSEWKGRVCVTCNADEESMMQVPETGLSNLDKLILVRIANVAPVIYPSQADISCILERELPWLARWLLDWEIPAELMGESRFGVRSYADSSLLETSRQSSRSAGFLEILEDWKHNIFVVQKRVEKFWTGTSFQLHKELHLDPGADAALRNLTVDAIGRHLASLKSTRKDVQTVEGSATRVWKIYHHNP